jgi:hypothetical protein
MNIYKSEMKLIYVLDEQRPLLKVFEVLFLLG